jgi:cold shock CspA family protein
VQSCFEAMIQNTTKQKETPKRFYSKENQLHMSKSHSTSGKKDREKKKQMQRKDKIQRKEERKANNNKGKSFEDMFAYVDEFGRISSTPPNPQYKTTINIDDIKISVPKQEAMDPADLIRKGTVTFFNDSKGYGFIRDLDSQESIFVHVNDLTAPIKENDKVTFEVVSGQKGLNAINVKPSV